MDVQIKDINYFKGLTDIASDTKIINHIENILSIFNKPIKETFD
jgi:hypothetical protein